jgi:hypothetical protein
MRDGIAWCAARCSLANFMSGKLDLLYIAHRAAERTLVKECGVPDEWLRKRRGWAMCVRFPTGVTKPPYAHGAASCVHMLRDMHVVAMRKWVAHTRSVEVSHVEIE